MKKYKNFILFNIYILTIALTYLLILIPNKIVSGGFMSLAMILYYFFEVNNYIADAGLGIAIIEILMNIPLIVYCLRLFGKRFVLKTIYGTFILPIFTATISLLFELFKISIEPMPLWMASMLGGLGVGIGIAGAASLGGSSGGVDMIARILNRFFSKITIGSGVAISKLIILFLSVFVIDIKNVLFSVVAVLSTGLSVDLFSNILGYL